MRKPVGNIAHRFSYVGNIILEKSLGKVYNKEKRRIG